jgi:type I restriction enzyme, S subunit
MSGQWPLKPLGDICEILDKLRKPITKRDRVSGEYPYYGATGIVDYVDGYIFDEKLILIGEDGAKWESGENTAFSVEGKCWVNNHAHVIRPNRNIVLDNWLIYFLNMSDLTEHITGLTVPKLNQGKLRAIQIPIPPLKEQKRIVSILDNAFERISNSEKNSQSEFNAASELLESHINSIFENPSTSWRDTILGEISERVCVGFVGSTSKHYRDDGILFLRTKNVGRTGEVNLDDVKYITKEFHDSTKKSQLKSGDVILSRVVTDRINCAFIPEKFPEANCANVVIVRPGLAVDSRFLVYYIKSRTSQNYLLSKRKGSAQLVVNTTIVKQWPVKIPPLEVQQQIVRELDVMVQQVSELMEISQNKSQHYLNLKQSILQEAFSGKLTGGIAA